MKNLITSALPYANGPIHFGHIAGVYLPADIYTRHKKLIGEETIHISGSDEHGVAIMQNAQKAKIPYQEYVNKWHQEHKELFNEYEITFDFFGQTSSEYHALETKKWFKSLHEAGLIEKQQDEQLQCQSCHNYLPDRFVEGTCYKCDYSEARGDECPNCGEWIDAVKLIDPVCKFCGSKDIEVKTVDQWYLMMTKYHKEYREWLATKKDTWKRSVFAYVDSLSKEKMVDRAITRDLDWGIDVPLDEAKGKKLYVWFDAPIGYVSNTKEFCKAHGGDYLKDWWQNPATKITNFIGKDNIIFHSLIFPVMSMASGEVKAVDDLPANQYVNLEGQQFSKSKGHYVDAKEAIDTFGATNLRFYLTTLIPENQDSSFTWEGFEAKVNNELANNIGNFVNRSLSFFYKNWPDGIAIGHFQSFFSSPAASELEAHFKAFHEDMNNVALKKSLERILSISQTANVFFSDGAPWASIKVDQEKAAQTIAHSSIYVLSIACMLEPFLPELAKSILAYFPKELLQSKESIYRGNFESLQKAKMESIAVSSKPSALVKKLEEEDIQKFKT